MKLLSIGQFATLVGLSVSTLRFYADGGLLLPAHVDQESGYRYYTPEQVALGQKIATLRRLDLPLAELAQVLSATGRDAVVILERHEQRLYQEFQKKRLILRALAEHLTDQRSLPKIEAIYRQWPEQHVLAATMNSEADTFNAEYRHLAGQLRQLALEHSVTVIGNEFGLYHAVEYLGGPLQAEVCLPVQQPCPGRGRIRFMTLPPVQVVCAIHEGDWRSFSTTFAVLYFNATEKGHQPGSSYTLDTPQGTELGFLLN